MFFLGGGGGIVCVFYCLFVWREDFVVVVVVIDLEISILEHAVHSIYNWHTWVLKFILLFSSTFNVIFSNVCVLWRIF